MPVNPYDDRKVSLRRPLGNGDLDIVWASYTRRMANVTEALMIKNVKMFVVKSLNVCIETPKCVDGKTLSTKIIPSLFAEDNSLQRQ